MQTWAINRIGDKIVGSALIAKFNEIINKAIAAKRLQCNDDR